MTKMMPQAGKKTIRSLVDPNTCSLLLSSDWRMPIPAMSICLMLLKSKHEGCNCSKCKFREKFVLICTSERKVVALLTLESELVITRNS